MFAKGLKWKRKWGHPLSPPCYIPHHHHVMPFRIPFAGEGEFFTPDSVLSHCYGALLPMFDTKEATTLRQLCTEFKTTVADFPWEDEETVIKGSVASWRACFPRARWANVSQWHEVRRTPLVDADFVHFVGLKRLNTSHCTSITDAAFVHLKGIHSLDLFGCYQLTSVVFTHLKGVKRLNIGWCQQLNLTDDSLKGIEWLEMSNHSQEQIDSAERLGYPVSQDFLSEI